jgi:hypothetical protein
MKLTKSDITKVCGRKGIRPDIVNRFVSGLTGNKENDLEILNKTSNNWNLATIKAIRDCIDIAYKEVPKCRHDPRTLAGQSIGQYYCPECNKVVIAGLEHT